MQVKTNLYISMGIRDDFSNYIDGNGLNTPLPGTWTTDQNGSDNGPLFTSIYYILLNKNGQLTDQDKLSYASKINQCIGSDLLNRVPVGQNDGLEGPDDLYGTLSGCIELGNTEIPRKLLWGCIKYKGSLYNTDPGKWQWQAFLIRQLGLLAAMVSAAFPSLVNPLHWLVRLICHPLFIFSALVIGFSNMSENVTDTDTRQLTWTLQNNLKKTSLWCWLASKVWFWRLKKYYGPSLMKSVAAVYYSPNGLDKNPYSKWWAD
jgi:hypothetical protein